MSQIDFYFDFRSPYAYFACQRLQLLTSEGVTINWKPVFVDVLLNLQADKAPWDEITDPLCPPKRDHFMADIFRLIKYWEIDFAMPSPPVPSCNKAMAVAALLEQSGVELTAFATSMFTAVWQKQKDGNDPAVIISCLKDNQLDEGLVNQIDGEAKNLLTRNTVAAFECGVFGVPTFVQEGELYFGADRMELIAANQK
jgi:2-hydroxychromene-2-carboxylate isomerase